MVEKSPSYNERLFSGGLRKWVHEQRFHSLRAASEGLSGSVFKLGCFDARSLDYLAFAPNRYLGVDAGWEGGLDSAQARFPQYEFHRENAPRKLDEEFDVAICLETLEHVPRSEMSAYVDMLRQAAPVLLCSVPVEIGPVFLSRYLAKFAMGGTEEYSAADVVNLTFNRTLAVEQNQHKGFDYRALVKILRSKYRQVTLQGLPIGVAPYLSLTVGIKALR